jgi:RNA polymerase sporulation-specific sigma factor
MRESGSDEELVKRAQAGDRQATEEILERYKNVVRARARSFFLVGGETEDLIQEGMVGLYNAIHAYDEEKSQRVSFKNFVYLCVSRRIIDAVKSASRDKNAPLNNYVSIFDSDFELADDYSAEDELIETENRTEFLQKMSKALSAFEFQIVVMYMDGMSYAQIAEATGKDVKSVDNALQRSKKKLTGIFKR